MKIMFIAMFVIFFIVGTMTIANAQAASISVNFVSSFGNVDSTDGLLAIPQGIALDNSGNIYVADQMHHRVAKFDSTGTFITQIGIGHLDAPTNIALDNSGNIYVVDVGNLGINKFDSSGNFVSKFGNFSMNEAGIKEPQGIALDKSGNIFVTDFSNIEKYDSAGNFVSKFGTWGIKDGQLNSTGDMAVDNSGNIYVADGNGRVEKFSNNGTFLAKWGSYCSMGNFHSTACHDPDGSGPLDVGDGQFANVEGIALDKFGNVFVTDMNNDRVQVFDPSGNFLYKFGSSGAENGQFMDPNGIALDNSGNLYVVDQNNARVQIFNIDYNGMTSASNNTTSQPPTIAATSIFSSANPSTSGQPVSFTATMSHSSPIETVQFAIDGVNIGTPIAVSGSSATLSGISNLTVGSHAITATYSGDGNLLASTATYTQVVNSSSTAQTTTSTTITQPSSVPALSSIQKIPSWAKSIFYYYGQGQISDSALINAINFLVQQNIIQLKS